MSYDEKFKKRTIEYLNEGHTYRKTTKVFGISVTTLQRWLKEKDKVQSDSKKQTRKGKTNEELLSRYLKANPDAYQSEIAEQFGCRQQSVCIALKKFGYTRKKRRNGTKSKTA